MSHDAYWVWKKGSIVNSLKDGVREDGRALDEYRPIKIQTGLFHHAEGSAQVELGKTRVVAGIKMGLETPYPDSPDRGNLITNIEMNALASPDFENGPPRENAIELSRVVDRVIRESEFIDFPKLVIREGELVWVVFADVRVLNYDGNLFDACALAVAAALMTAKVPKVEDDRVVSGEWTTKKLPLTTLATMTTFYKLGDQIVVDAGLNEDMSLDARVSVGVTESGKLCALQKGGNGSFSYDEMMRILNSDSLATSKKLLKELKSQVKA